MNQIDASAMAAAKARQAVILKRFPVIEVVADLKRLLSNFVRGITGLPVPIPG